MRALTLSRVRTKDARDLVDRQFLDIAQQDHLAIMIGQRLDGARKDRCECLRAQDAPDAGSPTASAASVGPFPSTGAAGEGRRGAPPRTATPRTTSPRAACRPAGTTAAAFPGPRRRYRPRGNCARHSGGCRAGPTAISETSAFGVAAARGLDQRGDRTARRRRRHAEMSSDQPKASGRPWRTSGKSRKNRSGSRPAPVPAIR